MVHLDGLLRKTRKSVVLHTRVLRRFEAGDDSGVCVGFIAMDDEGFVAS